MDEEILNKCKDPVTSHIGKRVAVIRYPRARPDRAFDH